MILVKDINEMLLTEDNYDCEFISIKIKGLDSFLKTLSFIIDLQAELPDVKPWGCDAEEVLIDIPNECGVSLSYSGKDLMDALDKLPTEYDINPNIDRIIVDRSEDGSYERIVTYKYKKKVSE